MRRSSNEKAYARMTALQAVAERDAQIAALKALLREAVTHIHLCGCPTGMWEDTRIAQSDCRLLRARALSARIKNEIGDDHNYG